MPTQQHIYIGQIFWGSNVFQTFPLLPRRTTFLSFRKWMSHHIDCQYLYSHMDDSTQLTDPQVCQPVPQFIRSRLVLRLPGFSIAYDVYTVILLYDHALTFGDECKYIWSQPTKRSSLWFCLNRYYAAIGVSTTSNNLPK